MGDPKARDRGQGPRREAMENNTFVAFADMDAEPDQGVARRPPQRPAKWKWHYDYAFAKRPGEELYDLRKDPEQVKNVAADPAYEADAEAARGAVDEDPDRRRRPAAGREGLPLREVAVHRRRSRGRSDYHYRGHSRVPTPLPLRRRSARAGRVARPTQSARTSSGSSWTTCPRTSRATARRRSTTPHVDQLAAEGTRFSKAFVTAPVCSPCRSALITGCYQTTIGAHHHRSGRGELKIHLPGDVVPVPVLFQKAGYYTCIGGFGATGDTLGKTDYNFEWDREDVRRQRLGRPQAGPAVLHAGATPRRQAPRAGAEQELAGAGCRRNSGRTPSPRT